MENNTDRSHVHEQGMSTVHVLIGIVILMGIAMVYLYYHFEGYQSPDSICTSQGGVWEDDSSTCVFEILPPEEETPGGVATTTPVASAQYKDVLRVDMPKSGAKVTSPLTVKGVARGPWFFEASFPITLTDWDGKIIAEGHAQADEEWMTNEYVPFTGTLTFTVPADTPYRRGTLIFKKDNPSGLPQNDDAFEIPVTF